MTTLAPVTSAEQLCTLVGDLWTSLAGDELGPVELVGATDGTSAATAGDVLSLVSITGAWNGHLALSLTIAGASLIAQAMFGTGGGEVAAADLSDAVGELGNIIAGNIKSILPEPSVLSLPTVVFDAQKFSLPSASLDVLAPMSWGGHAIVVSLWQANTMKAMTPHATDNC